MRGGSVSTLAGEASVGPSPCMGNPLPCSWWQGGAGSATLQSLGGSVPCSGFGTTRLLCTWGLQEARPALLPEVLLQVATCMPDRWTMRQAHGLPCRKDKKSPVFSRTPACVVHYSVCCSWVVRLPCRPFLQRSLICKPGAHNPTCPLPSHPAQKTFRCRGGAEAFNQGHALQELGVPTVRLKRFVRVGLSSHVDVLDNPGVVNASC